MNLYMTPVAPNPTRVRLYVAEKNAGGAGIDLNEIRINLLNGEQNGADHLARNVFARVPVLERTLADARPFQRPAGGLAVVVSYCHIYPAMRIDPVYFSDCAFHSNVLGHHVVAVRVMCENRQTGHGSADTDKNFARKIHFDSRCLSAAVAAD